jgi:hypothetical protein
MLGRLLSPALFLRVIREPLERDEREWGVGSRE